MYVSWTVSHQITNTGSVFFSLMPFLLHFSLSHSIKTQTRFFCSLPPFFSNSCKFISFFPDRKRQHTRTTLQIQHRQLLLLALHLLLLRVKPAVRSREEENKFPFFSSLTHANNRTENKVLAHTRTHVCLSVCSRASACLSVLSAVLRFELKSEEGDQLLAELSGKVTSAQWQKKEKEEKDRENRELGWAEGEEEEYEERRIEDVRFVSFHSMRKLTGGKKDVSGLRWRCMYFGAASKLDTNAASLLRVDRRMVYAESWGLLC